MIIGPKNVPLVQQSGLLIFFAH